MMYGVRFVNGKIEILKAPVEELETKGMTICQSRTEAEAKGINMEYIANRKRFNSLSLEELDSKEAYELEQKIWGRFATAEEFIPGEYIQKRKEFLMEQGK